jgi:beta-phosphoglucomutase-like phosphatase (HAD superfamily)
MSNLELVIFDCDGVLVDSEVISNSVLARALSAEGLPTTLAQARREYQGLLLSQVVQRAQQNLGRRDTPHPRRATGDADDLIVSFAAVRFAGDRSARAVDPAGDQPVA